MSFTKLMAAINNGFFKNPSKFISDLIKLSDNEAQRVLYALQEAEGRANYYGEGISYIKRIEGQTFADSDLDYSSDDNDDDNNFGRIQLFNRFYEQETANESDSMMVLMTIYYQPYI